MSNLNQIKQYAEDAIRKSAIKQAARNKGSKHVQSQQTRADCITAWSESRWFPPLLAPTEKNFLTLGTALLGEELLSIASISEVVRKLTLEKKLDYLQGEPTVVEKVVYREAPKTVEQTEKQRSDELEKLGIYTKRKDQFDVVEENDLRNKRDQVMSVEEKDRRALKHYEAEAHAILNLIHNYKYLRSKIVQEYRTQKLKSISIRDSDGFLNLPAMLVQTERMIASFSDSMEDHAAALAEATKGLAAKVQGRGPYVPKPISRYTS